jgi:hypothetical protein
MNNNYYNKYLKYKNKYSQLKFNFNNKKGGSKILYENIIGDIVPNSNPITMSTDLEPIPISDHYLLFKSIELSDSKKINLFDINISQLYQFKTKIKAQLLFNTMRSKKNLEFMYSNKKDIIDLILEISKNNTHLLKNNKIKVIKNLFLKKMSELGLSELVDFSDLEISIVKINPREAKSHITENLKLDLDTNLYYTFDIEFNRESLEGYKKRIKKFFEIFTVNIQLLGDDLLHNNYLVINIQELSPLDEILYLFNDFIEEIKTNLQIELKLVYPNTQPINSLSTYSLSIVSANTDYFITDDYVDESSSEPDSEPDDILEYIIKQKANILNKNFKMISSNSNLPPIYNFHTGMFYHDDFEEFITCVNNHNKFIICGDLNLKLDSYDSIRCIRKKAIQKNIKVEFCSTPESNYPVNNYTYDVIMYRI